METFVRWDIILHISTKLAVLTIKKNVETLHLALCSRIGLSLNTLVYSSIGLECNLLISLFDLMTISSTFIKSLILDLLSEVWPIYLTYIHNNGGTIWKSNIISMLVSHVQNLFLKSLVMVAPPTIVYF